MLKRARKTRSILKSILYIFFSSALFLLVLNLMFPKISWFRKPILINPVIKDNSRDGSKIEKLLLDSGIQFAFVNLVSDYFRITFIDNSRVYVSSKKDFAAQISSLTAILKQLTINGKRFNLIDFRFDKPVIIFEK